MARLPQPGSDYGSWGDVLNEYLRQSHTDSGALKPNIVGPTELATNAVTSTAIANGTITEAQLSAALKSKVNTTATGIADGSVTTTQLADASVTAAKISPATITNTHIATTAAIAQSKIDNLTTDLAAKASNTAVVHLTGDEVVAGNKNFTGILTSSGSAVVVTGDARLTNTRTPTDDTVSTGKLQNDSVTTLKINDGAVTASKLATGAVTKTAVGLGNVDNTSDANKPVSSATQTALNAKANTSSLATVATSGSYTDLTSKPTIPAQLNPTAGANITIGGTYPNLTFSSTAGGGGGGGDMYIATYDPNAVSADAFSQDNMLDGTTNKNYTLTEKTKLSGVEASADVTDTANVTAAGAVMDSDVTNLAQVKSFSSADYATAAQGTASTSHIADTSNPHSVTKTQVGLSNVPNTDFTSAVAANTAKVTNATHTGDVTGATALTIAASAVTNSKMASMATKTYKGNTTGSIAAPTDVPVATLKTDLALGNVDNTSDASKPVSSATQTALNGKVTALGTLRLWPASTSFPSTGVQEGDLFPYIGS